MNNIYNLPSPLWAYMSLCINMHLQCQIIHDTHKYKQYVMKRFTYIHVIKQQEGRHNLIE